MPVESDLPREPEVVVPSLRVGRVVLFVVFFVLAIIAPAVLAWILGLAFAAFVIGAFVRLVVWIFTRVFVR